MAANKSDHSESESLALALELLVLAPVARGRQPESWPPSLSGSSLPGDCQWVQLGFGGRPPATSNPPASGWASSESTGPASAAVGIPYGPWRLLVTRTIKLSKC